MATEHAALSASLAESFDAKVAKRVGELAPIANTLKEWDNANEVCRPFLTRLVFIYLRYTVWLQ